MFLEPLWLLWFEHASVFILDSFGGLLSSLIEFISFHSLFVHSFHSIARIRYTHELKEGHYRPLSFVLGMSFVHL